jgi:hypothetical protein
MSKGGMPEALRYLFIIYFVTHIPITMLIDGQVWITTQWQHTIGLTYHYVMRSLSLSKEV